MAWSFGDGFDLYATTADAINGYWDSSPNGWSLNATGRFAGSRSFTGALTGVNLVKSSGVNDAVHHLVMAFRQVTALSGTTLVQYLQLLDGTTGQCCVGFRSDGAILLTSGTPGGTVLATYPAAFPAAATWYAFEFEIIIHNTTGRFRVRKNGNTSDDFDSGAVLNTRVSANNYANRLQLGINTGSWAQLFDDLFWRSDASSVAWLGDLRCYTRMPVTDASVQFSGAGTRSIAVAAGSNTSMVANRVFYTPFTWSYTGTFSSVVVTTLGTAYVGNYKCAIFNDNGSGAPGTVLATATNVVTNPPVTSTMTFNFSPSVSVAIGQQIWMGICPDAAGSAVLASTGSLGWFGTTTYASYPAANPTGLALAGSIQSTITITPLNSSLVSEPQQDALATYVYDSTVGHADFYNVGTITTSPGAVIALTTRGYMQKSDAGSRTAAMQTKSGSTTVATSAVVLTTSGWQWAWRMDLTDPNTGAAWTGANANAVQIGPTVIS